mmetsp:Transcript_17915/g.36152  ORF Transcript_17915/g.36152 Transcript_17915/m.36152 type:complete len:83 (+) Transcript_17915:1787-2035(+)
MFTRLSGAKQLISSQAGRETAAVHGYVDSGCTCSTLPQAGSLTHVQHVATSRLPHTRAKKQHRHNMDFIALLLSPKFTGNCA